MSNFTNSPLVSFTRLSPHRNSPRNQPVSAQTIHHFAGNLSLAALGEHLARPTTQASYNYRIDIHGNIGLYVPERDRCWGSSSPANDHRAIVIGVANSTGAPSWGISQATFDALIDLCVCICRRNPGIVQINGMPGLHYNGLPSGSLTRHNMFVATICPGPHLQERFPEIVRLVNARLAPPVVQPPIIDIPEEVEEVTREQFDKMMDDYMRRRGLLEPSGWATDELARAVAGGITDGQRPQQFATREEAAVMVLRAAERVMASAGE